MQVLPGPTPRKNLPRMTTADVAAACAAAGFKFSLISDHYHLDSGQLFFGISAVLMLLGRAL